MEKLQHDGLLNLTDIKSLENYVSCISGKMAKKSYSHQVERAKNLLGLIHTDVCGLFKIMSRQGAYYFITFTEDFGQNQLGKTIKLLRSDRGGEYMSQEFLDHLRDHGIIAHRTPPYMPQMNGVSERINRTLLDMVRSMMSQTTLSKSFWDYALESAACILNMVPTKKRDTLTKPNKLESRSIKFIFVGYPKETMEYSFYYPPKNKFFVARNAEFLENSLINQEASGSLEDFEIIQEEDTYPFVDTSLYHEVDGQEIDEPQSDINPIRRCTRTRRSPYRMCLYIDAEEHELGDLGEPANFDLPPNGKTIGHKWLIKKKIDMDRAIHTYKARLVAKGFTQTPRIDYEETFSLVVDIRAIRILIAMAAFYDYEIWQMDVKTTFLNGYLDEEVYMEQLEGFVNQKFPNRICKLKRSFYGLKQASRQWNKRFDDEIKKFGFSQNRDEPCVYVKASGSYVTFLILSGRSNNPGEVHWTAVKNILKYLRNTKDMFLIYGGVVDWKSTKQSIFATSSTDVEYIAAFNTLKKVVWIHKFISRLGVVPKYEAINMYCDSTRAVAIVKDHGVIKGARHFRAKVYYLRETIEIGDVKIEKVDTDDNLADPFTKALTFPKHSELTKKIGMIPASNLM
nr:hypothetical protein [Tanacetum cinerariifolium]